MTPEVVTKASIKLCWPIDWLGLHREYAQDGEMEIIAALLREVEAKSMVEFGCRDGRTARVLLHNVSSLYDYIGVDVPFHSYKPELEHQRHEMVPDPGYLAFSDPRFRIIIAERGTRDLTPEHFSEPVNAVYIDGDHSANVVLYDSYLARALVGSNGVIIWHDYHHGDHVHVRPVIDRLCDQGWPIKHVGGTWLAFMRT